MAKSKDSNLFAIDHNAIVEVLKDANVLLLKRKDELMAAFERVPSDLSEDQLERAKKFTAQLQKAVGDSREARLSDGRPFRNAVATVKAFFDAIEGPMQDALREMRQRLTDVALRKRAESSVISLKPIGTDLQGKEVVTTLPLAEVPRGVDAGLKLVWEVAHVERRMLDLEALRPFITDAALMAACKKHLSEKGPHQLSGVQYSQTLAKSIQADSSD